MLQTSKFSVTKKTVVRQDQLRLHSAHLVCAHSKAPGGPFMARKKKGFPDVAVRRSHSVLIVYSVQTPHDSEYKITPLRLFRSNDAL